MCLFSAEESYGLEQHEWESMMTDFLFMNSFHYYFHNRSSLLNGTMAIAQGSVRVGFKPTTFQAQFKLITIQ